MRSNQNRQILKDFKQVNLVANNDSYGAARVDTSLQNAWGIAFSPNGIIWVNANAGHVSELYDKDGNQVRPAVAIPSPGDTINGTPTGIVFSGTTDFMLSNGKPALFLFVGDDGVFSGWNPPPANRALMIKDNSSTSSYFGLAIASNGGTNFLYAANFKTGKIDAWDNMLMPQSLPFTDPDLPAGYSPFNIQAIGSWLYVNYAKVGPDGNEVHQVGLGLVDIFNPDGSFVRRFASGGTLNAPWGITQAPADFFNDNDGDKDDQGQKVKEQGNSGDPIILVGNFGDGHINAFSLSGDFLGQLKSHGKKLWIDGLWALVFPPASATSIDPNRLYFASGPADEKDGLFGYIIKD
jgi:uncharacterized protein (TIGR03118 family)